MTISLATTTNKKTLYAVLWVDDYGSLTLRERDARWYHENAGPMSLAVQCDDRFPWGFDLAFSSVLNNGHPQDYLSHHLHPERYVGWAGPKRVYDALRLYFLVWSFLRLRPFIANASRGFFLFGLTVALLAAAFALFVFSFSNLVAFFIVLALCVCGVSLVATWYYVQLPRNWEYLFADRASITALILKAEAEFRKRGLAYPAVIRHGWNLPWADSMPFYMEMGVVADASAVSVGDEKHATRNGREIEWCESQPYVASLTRDYNVAWDGEKAQDRGILELPVNLGNIPAYGFGENERRLIEIIPDGGLVSCYVHPQDDFSAVRDWVNYLKQRYDVRFVSAEQAATIYRAQSAIV